MLTQPINAIQAPNKAAILQLNCGRYHHITLSLFNDKNSANFFFIALQEPPVNAVTNRPNWHGGGQLISHTTSNPLEDSRPQSCIYINKKLNPRILPIDCHSRDVTACTVKVNGVETMLVNVYNQLSTFKGFDGMETMLKTLQTSFLMLPTIIVTDSNLHLALWNPDTYHVTMY